MTQSHIIATEADIVPVADIEPHPENPRKGNRTAIATSLRENGQYKPVIVQRSTGHIIVGNNTYLAARHDLGWDTIGVVYRDVDDTTAKKLLVIDNRTSDLAEYDDAALLDLLEGINVDLGSLESVAFSETDLDELRRTTDAFGDTAGAFLDTFANPTPEPTHHPGTPTPTPAPAPVPAPASNDAPTPHTNPTDPDTTPNTDAPPHPTPTGHTDTPPPGPMYVPVSYTLTVQERDELRTAVRTAQTDGNHDNQSDGLLAMARHYMDTRP